MRRKHLTGFALALALLMILMASCALAETRYVRTQGGHLNVRTWASTEAPLIGRLNYGQSVNVVGYDGSWAIINYNGRTGYVASRYLSSNRPSSAAPTYYNTSTTYVADNLNSLNAQLRTMQSVTPFQVKVNPSRPGSFVNLRWAPSQSVEVMARLYSGYNLNVIAVGSTWYQVSDPATGKVGFVMRSYTIQ
jgi:uncharacterized protein YraI